MRRFLDVSFVTGFSKFERTDCRSDGESRMHGMGWSDGASNAQSCGHVFEMLTLSSLPWDGPDSGSMESQHCRMSRTNHIFVDFENVQNVNLDLIADKPVRVYLFLGKQQNRVRTDLMKQVHRFHAQVELIEVDCAGKNALDSILAHHTGRVAAADPQGYFHILSGDKGFDALIIHLSSQNILAARTEVFAEIPILQDLRALPLNERLERVKERLAKLKKPDKDGRPKKVKSLCATIHAVFSKLLTDEDVRGVLDGLKKKKWIGISKDEKITYHF